MKEYSYSGSALRRTALMTFRWLLVPTLAALVVSCATDSSDLAESAKTTPPVVERPAEAAAPLLPEAWSGTWKLDLAKSKYEFSALPRSSVTKIQPAGEVFAMSQDSVDAQGRMVQTELTARLDGTDCPVNGFPNTRYAFTRIEHRTYEIVAKRSGEVITTTRTVVAPDGKTSTSTTTATNPQGQTVTNVAVYERQ